jgi:outer membrane protein assembly factor BamB
MVTLQKNGSVYLYDRDNIANGYRQRLVVAVGSDAAHTPVPVNEFIGVAAYSPETQLVYVANTTGTPDGAYVHGMLAIELDAGCNLVPAWQTTAGMKSFITGAPSVDNGVVYYADGAAGHLHAFDATTGQERWTSGSEVNAPMFTQPVVVNGQLFEGAYDNKLHAWGLN